MRRANEALQQTKPSVTTHGLVFAAERWCWADSSWLKRSRVGLLVTTALFSPFASATSFAEESSDHVAAAEQFFRGVYGCDATVVRELADPNVVMSYPIFETLFGKQSLRGAEAVEAFAKRFCGKWADPELEIHERLADGLRVVLVWSFSARDTAAGQSAPRSSWGGISFFTFNSDGRITAEVGEESSPGPIGRLEEATQ